jgi:chromosomal replication initiation ATPase DnaA
MARQLAFHLPVVTSRARGDFFVAAGNALAHTTLATPESWPGGKLVLVGPEGSGKSHLAGIFAENTGATLIASADLESIAPDRLATAPVVVDDADRIAGNRAAETALFHLHNMVLAARQPLLVTARSAPARWGITLPDLASRMEAAGLAQIESPDDALLSAVLVKLFSDRQLDVPPNLIAYLVPRIDRSLAAAAQVVARLDQAALAEKRPVTRDLARQVLELG